MYFVVFLETIAESKYVVIPITWINNGPDLWQKFVNKGLNTNQTHLCFYSKKNNQAFDGNGKIKETFLPNFGEDNIKQQLFECKIVKYFSK